MTDTDSTRARYEVGAFKRGLLILDCFASHPDQSLTASDVARSLGIHRATAFRFLATLESSGYIQTAEGQGCYRLADRWRPRRAEPSWPSVLPMIAVPILRELAEETGETSDMGVYYAGEVTMVHVIEGQQSVRAHGKVGASRPLHVTAIGKAILSTFGEQELEDWLRGRQLAGRTPNSITSRERLCSELAEIRRCGYAVDEQEFELGLTCVAAPIRDASGAAIAGVATSGPSSRFTYHRIPDLAAAVQRAAMRLSAASGSLSHPA